MTIPYSLHKKMLAYIKEDRFSDLKDILIDAIETLPKNDSTTLEKLVGTLREPIIRKNIEKWAKSKKLPDKMVTYLTGLIVSTNSLSFEEKIELSELFGNDEALMDFTKMIKGSINKSVTPSQYFKHGKFADFIMSATKNSNDKQLLGAPTNIGRGEVAFIIAGNLEKPTQGDLQDGSNVIELKEPTAFIGPKGVSHPSKNIKDMRRFIAKLLPNAKLPKDDRFKGRGGKAEDALSILLMIKYANGKGEFPLGQWAKRQGVSIADVKKIVNKMHDYAYPFAFDAGKYVNNDFSFDFAKYGRDGFGALYDLYKTQSAFETLMVFDVTKDKVYCIKSTDDAKKLWDKAGKVLFYANDAHGLDGALGGRLNPTAFKNLL